MLAEYVIEDRDEEDGPPVFGACTMLCASCVECVRSWHPWTEVERYEPRPARRTARRPPQTVRVPLPLDSSTEALGERIREGFGPE